MCPGGEVSIHSLEPGRAPLATVDGQAVKWRCHGSGQVGGADAGTTPELTPPAVRPPA
jgi:hypothetical protein